MSSHDAQTSLFFAREERAIKAEERADELRRVRSEIAYSVQAFLYTRAEHGPQTFYGAELTRHVTTHARCAPDSVTRIMRDARENGWIRYECIDRSKAQYRIDFVKPISQWITPEDNRTPLERAEELLRRIEERADVVRAHIAKMKEEAA